MLCCGAGPVLGSFSAQVMYFAVASGQRCGSWIVLTATCMPTITATSTSTSTVDIDGAIQVPAASWYLLSGLPSLCMYCRRGQAVFVVVSVVVVGSGCKWTPEANGGFDDSMSRYLGWCK